MANFNRKKFLEAILDLADTQTPAVPPAQNPRLPSFAKFLAAKTYGATDETDGAILGAQSQQENEANEQDEGALSKTFGWLMGSMNQVQNSIMDLTNDELDTSEKLEGLGKNFLAAGAHWLQPLAEVIAIPGADVPWEPESLSDFIQKHNTEYHGTGPISGKRILEERLGLDPDKNFRNAALGFGVDVFSDPLTYLPFGILSKAGKAKELLSKVDNAFDANRMTDEFIASRSLKLKGKPAHLGSEIPLFHPKGRFELPQAPSVRNIGKVDYQSPLFRSTPDLAPPPVAPKRFFADLGIEDKMLMNRTRGRKLLEAKFAKNKPRQVFNPKIGLNSRLVMQAISHVADNLEEPLVKFAMPDNDDIINATIHFTDSFASRITGDLTPKAQAALFTQLWKKADDLAPQGMSEGKRIAWKRDHVPQMLKLAEDRLLKIHKIHPVHWTGSGLRLSAVFEEIATNVGRLTNDDVAKAVEAFAKDPNKIRDPVALEAISKAIARRSFEAAAVAKNVLDDFTKASVLVEKNVPRHKFLEWRAETATKKARTFARTHGLTKAEADAVVDSVKNHVNVQGLESMEATKILDVLPQRVIEAVKAGHTDHRIIHTMNKALQRAVNETARQQRKSLGQETALDTFLMRWTTWHGRGDMIHAQKEAYSYIEEWAKARADWFSNMVKDYTPDQILIAFRRAQGHMKELEARMAEQGLKLDDAGLTPEIIRLSDQMTDYFESIVASSRTINNMDGLRGSVAIRAEAMMDDVNRELKHLGSDFQFKNSGRIKQSVTGKKADYTGDNWLTYWENVDATKWKQDPARFLYDLSLAMDRTLAQYSLVDDFVMRFGRHPHGDDFVPGYHTEPVHHHRIDPEYMFDPATGKAFRKLLDDMEKGSWFPEQKFMREMVKYQRMWKTGVTQYSPSFHIRNAIGDTFLMWLAGHNNPIYFRHAAKMIAANRKRYADAIQDPKLSRLQGLMSKDEYGLAISDSNRVILRKYGANLTSEEIYGEMLMRGQLLDANRASDIIGEPLFAHTAGRNPSAMRRAVENPLGGHLHRRVMKATEIREHSIRLAHFTAVVDKNLTPKLARKLQKIANDPSIGNKVAERRKIMQEVYDKASQEVRKWHPDGRDLSYLEQAVMRNIIPFYSWQRKVIPLLAEAMLIRPAKLTMYPKGMFALQQSLGIDAPGITQPFPTDQIYPDWMRDLGMGPIGDPESDNPVAAWFGRLGRNMVVPGGGETGYTVINPGNPFNDEIAQFGAGGESITDSALKASGLLTPYFNIPKEFFSDTKWTGAPISKDEGGSGYVNWSLAQIPNVAAANRMFNIGAKQQKDAEPGFDTEAFLNWLTAGGIKGTGQYRKSAEFDAKQAAIRRAVEEGG